MRPMHPLLFYLLVAAGIAIAIPVAVIIIASAMAVAAVVAAAGWIAAAMAPRGGGTRDREGRLVIEADYTVVGEPARVRRHPNSGRD